MLIIIVTPGFVKFLAIGLRAKKAVGSWSMLLRISFHYGPDYQSDLDNLGPSFFAMGPLFSWQAGLAFKKDGVVKSVPGLKVFYVPLFAKDRSPGTVLGGALLYTYYLN